MQYKTTDEDKPVAPMARPAALTRDGVAKAMAKLQSLPEKAVEAPTLHQAVSENVSVIMTAIERGYTRKDIANLLTENGIAISESTLAHYLRDIVAKGKRSGGRAARTPRPAVAPPAPPARSVASQIAGPTAGPPTACATGQHHTMPQGISPPAIARPMSNPAPPSVSSDRQGESGNGQGG